LAAFNAAAGGRHSLASADVPNVPKDEAKGVTPC